MSFPREPLHNGRPNAPYLPGCSPINLSNRGRHSREYLDAHKNVEKRQRDRINNCLETIRQCVPACRKVPLTRRLEKGEILDMTISYLQLVNHFLAGIGVHDVYSASKQELHLYTGVDNWIRENHSNYTLVSEFAQDLQRLLQNETEIFSAQITMEHSWLSRKSAAFGDMYTEGDGYTQMAAYQSETDYEDEKPFVPSNDYQDKSPPNISLSIPVPVPKSPPKPVLIKQECCSSAESPTKKLKLVENSTVIKSLNSPESKSYMCANITSPAKTPKLVKNRIPNLVANPCDRSLDNGEVATHQVGCIAVLQSWKESSCHQRDLNLKANGDSLPSPPSSDVQSQSTSCHPQRPPPEAGETAPSSQSHHNSTSSNPQRPSVASESAPSSQSQQHTYSHPQTTPIAFKSASSSQSQHQSTCAHLQTTPVASETTPSSQSHHSSTSSHPQRPHILSGEVSPSSSMPCNSQCHSLGDVRVSTSMGCVTIPIRLGSIQIAAPKEMLQPLQQACMSPIVFNAQIESSDCPPVGEKCLCRSQTCQQQQKPRGLSIQVTESKEVQM